MLLQHGTTIFRQMPRIITGIMFVIFLITVTVTAVIQIAEKQLTYLQQSASASILTTGTGSTTMSLHRTDDDSVDGLSTASNTTPGLPVCGHPHATPLD